MTAYRDWLRDFPNRCVEILTLLEPQAREHDREVTLMLCAGSILLNVPLERLKLRLDKLNQPIEHPMSGHPDEAAREANKGLALKFRRCWIRRCSQPLQPCGASAMGRPRESGGPETSARNTTRPGPMVGSGPARTEYGRRYGLPAWLRTHYALWQPNSCRRTMNRLASAQVTSRRCVNRVLIVSGARAPVVR
jgi:hypothetical protein